MKRKIPRGKGYDKAATLSHLKKMVKGGIFVTEYVKQAGLKLDTFMLAANQYQPEALLYREVKTDPKLITQQCEQCGEDFWPRRHGARFCSPYCGNAFRKDQEYFGGRRGETVGLAEGVCQLCQRTVAQGLSSHHIYGKGNDQDNEFLLALCKGCHQIVSELALKTWAGDLDKLGKLIWLANTQRNGAEALALRQSERLGIRVEVLFHPASYLPS